MSPKKLEAQPSLGSVISWLELQRKLTTGESLKRVLESTLPTEETVPPSFLNFIRAFGWETMLMIGAKNLAASTAMSPTESINKAALTESPSAGEPDWEVALSQVRWQLRLSSKKRAPRYWAHLNHRLGMIYLKREKGKTAVNMQKASEAFKAALSVRDQSLQPFAWAASMICLAWTHAAFLADEESHFQEGRRLLDQVLTKELVPSSTRALALMVLGLLYYECPGRKMSDLNRASNCIQESCGIWDVRGFGDWSACAYNLQGNILSDFPDASPEMLRKAEDHYLNALRIWDQGNFPRQNAETIINLTCLYRIWPGDERLKKKQEGIELLKGLLEKKHPAINTLYPSILNNLGVAHMSLPNGYESENQELAETCFRRCQSSEAKGYSIKIWASALHNLGCLLLQKGTGPRNKNIEQAIACFERSLKSYSVISNLNDWVNTSLMLCTAYRCRERGNEEKTLQQCHKIYLKILIYCTRDSHPDEWASAQKGLADLYSHPDFSGYCLTKSIMQIGKALGIYRFYQDFEPWLDTMSKLALIIQENNSDQKLSIAIKIINKALSTTPEKDYPLQHADLHNQISLALMNKNSPSREEQILAIRHAEMACKHYSKEHSLPDWADSTITLAMAHGQLSYGNKTSNSEKAYNLLRSVIETLDRDLYPDLWATAMHNYGISLHYRNLGHQQLNIEQSRTAFLQALEIRKHEADTHQWAQTIIRLGQSYFYTSSDTNDMNTKKAIHLFEKGIKFTSQNRDPFNWGIAHICLANCYGSTSISSSLRSRQKAMLLIQKVSNHSWWQKDDGRLTIRYQIANMLAGWCRDDSAYLQQAIDAFTQILQSSPDHLDNMNANIRLGSLYFFTQQFALAEQHLQEGLKLRALQLKSTSSQLEELNSLSSHSEVPLDAAYALVRLGKPLEAVLLLEQWRGRVQRSLLQLRQPISDNPELDALRIKIFTLEKEILHMEYVWARNYETASAELERLKEQLKQLPGDPCLAFETQITREELEQTAGEIKAPIVYIWVTEHGTQVIAINPLAPNNTELYTLEIDTFRYLNLIEIFESDQARLLETLLNQKDFQSEKIPIIIEQLKTKLAPKLSTWLRDCGFDRIAVVTCGILSALPLQALDLPATVFYVPSCHLIRRALGFKTSGPNMRLLAVSHHAIDEEILEYSDLELDLVASLPWQSQKTLKNEAADFDNLCEHVPQASVLHLAAHGVFAHLSALDSYIQLEGEDCLNVRDILIGEPEVCALDLIVLSSCNSGLQDVAGSVDEAIGFGAVLVAAGARTVLSCQWPVADLSAAIFVYRYFRHLMDGQDALNALELTRRDFQEKTVEELDLMNILQEQMTRSTSPRLIQGLRYYQRNPKVIPFASPEYWAGYCLWGIPSTRLR